MHAIHSNWTKPRTRAFGKYFAEDFEILTTALSALKWREKNGTISMITDKTGYAFCKSRGLLDLWDDVSRDLDDIRDFIDPQIFWAAGKIYSLKNASVPVAVMDTDFIVWDMLAFENLDELTVIHREELCSDIYPDISRFEMKRGYNFSHSFDKNIKPANTAFYIIKNEQLRNMYVREAEDFMRNNLGTDNLTSMVFAEQRLLPMCAAALGIRTESFSDTERLFKNGDRYFTHVWGMKRQMRDNPLLRRDFCLKAAGRINSDFPEYVSVLSKIPETEIYFT